MRIFKNVKEFYKNRKRETSGELDFGCWWISRIAPGHTFRISWIENTGEFYAIDLMTNEIYLFDITCNTREEAEAHMEGWAEIPAKKRYIEKYFPEIISLS